MKTFKKSEAVSIRKATAEDVEEMWKIDQTCFVQEIAFTKKVFLYHLTVKNDPAFMAVADNKIAGFVIADRHDRETGLIVTIDVLADYRRRGIGSRLMDAAETSLKEDGFSFLLLQTPVNHWGAINFYVGRGYRKLGLLEGYYGKNGDAFLYGKEIIELL
jgi:ribosomal-protein-alanine N-acetyltransferase